MEIKQLQNEGKFILFTSAIFVVLPTSIFRESKLAFNVLLSLPYVRTLNLYLQISLGYSTFKLLNSVTKDD